MINVIADNILSPLGDTTEQNYQAVVSGRSALCRYTNRWSLPEPFVASLFSLEQEHAFMREGMTRFEAMVMKSVGSALAQTDIDVTSADVVLVISTTKGNIDELSLSPSSSIPSSSSSEKRVSPSASAQHVATALGMTTTPIVVCNACISGVSALSLASRLLQQKTYRYAIVCGADSQNRFIVSGFQSLKAMSDEPCRPFDEERLGLNLGEAAATVILSSNDSITMSGVKGETAEATSAESCSGWHIVSSAVRNDAFHLSNPSRTGEGSRLAIESVVKGVEKGDLAVINAHGTATMYNDQMESVAIERAGLGAIPVNALKGIYGHTMGAAGVLETILTMHSLDQSVVLGTPGYAERGVSGRINIQKTSEMAQGTTFLKIISGFGGCNGAILLSKTSCGEQDVSTAQVTATMTELRTTHTVSITPNAVVLDGETIEVEGTGKAMLTSLYKSYVADYPKFYKMDVLSRLGFIATELLLRREGIERFLEREDRGVVLFNSHSSITADKEYLASISNDEEYFPSPSAFIYTLPNIVTGEIAIRNKYHGETAFYVLPQRDEETMSNIISATFADTAMSSLIVGWVDCESDDEFEASVSIVER